MPACKQFALAGIPRKYLLYDVDDVATLAYGLRSVSIVGLARKCRTILSVGESFEL
jgi:hypothetical protein